MKDTWQGCSLMLLLLMLIGASLWLFGKKDKHGTLLPSAIGSEVGIGSGNEGGDSFADSYSQQDPEVSIPGGRAIYGMNTTRLREEISCSSPSLSPAVSISGSQANHQLISFSGNEDAIRWGLSSQTCVHPALFLINLFLFSSLLF